MSTVTAITAAPVAVENADAAPAFRFVVDRKAALAAVEFLNSSVVEARNTIPVLSTIRMRATGPFVEFSGTDLDIFATINVECDDAAGDVAIMAKPLGVALKVAEADRVTIVAGPGKVAYVEADGMRHKLQTLPVDDAPRVAPLQDGGAGWLTDAAEFAADLKRLTPAISTEETRYYLNGVYMHVTGPDLVMASTNGHQLTKIARALPDGAETLPGVIVHRKALKAVAKAMGTKAKGNLMIRQKGARIEFSHGNIVLDCKLIDGTFPDYTRVIPSHNGKRIEVMADLMAEAVAKLVKVAGAAGDKAVIRLETGDRSLKLSTIGVELSSEVELPCGGSLDGVAVGFNGKYLMSILTGLDGLMVIDLESPAAPGLFRTENAAEMINVLMPMRI